MSDVLKRMLAGGKHSIKSRLVSKDELLLNSKRWDTEIPLLNTAFSGNPISGGVSPGLTMFAGPSKHFKSLFCLLIASAWQKKNKDGVVLFYNNEWGVNKKYFNQCGADIGRIVHLPFKSIEEIRNDLADRLENKIIQGDKIFILVDSIGNSASKKEREDAIDGKSVEDMTRAKKLKSLFRIVTPYLMPLEIPMLCVNHVYKTQEMFSKTIMSGGSGTYLSADNIFFVSRRVLKEDSKISLDGNKTHVGYDMVLTTEKSRDVKEGRKFPITVRWDRGVSTWSGMADLAEYFGVIEKKNRGSKGTQYIFVGADGKEVYANKNSKGGEPAIEDDNDFWSQIFAESDLESLIEKEYVG